MKRLILLLIAPYILLSQNATNETLIHDNIERSYILYLPSNYDGANSVPLVLNLHGYSSNAGQQLVYSKFYELADSENFILIHPEGTADNLGFQFWNSGCQFWNINNIDDVGFLNNLIDTIIFQYNIDTEKVYSMGMSNGGFMSYRLACELSDKIAAIASVTGSMCENQITSCSPNKPMPVMQIHGTADLTVSYEGGNFSEFASIDDVVSYWVGLNNCDFNPILNIVPDNNILDLCTVEHYFYDNGDNGSSVELYKIINGGHTWPGATIPLAGNNTNQDFNASQVIWDFFNKYNINGLIENNSSIQESETKKKKLKSIDILGREPANKGFQLHIYNDGSVNKKYLIK